MRRKGLFGLDNITLAILATVILLIIGLILFALIEPASEAAGGFGKSAAGEFE